MLRRVLTSNVTFTLGAMAVLSAVVVNVGFGRGEAPATDASADDLMLLLTRSDRDMDKVAADAVAAAKKRAYEEQKKAEEIARVKAERERKQARIRASASASAALARSNPSAAQNKAYGKRMNAYKGWSRCWPSLLTLWEHESNWNERAENPSSGAYGIPQALPGNKMATAGADWRTSSPTQIAWGLSYIKARYKDPCGAWSFWQRNNWY
ncbi:lytic transglycosylase domain-containing protein [Actinomadura craniellae]|uniref:Lytic transglycosylase domain-containing protein n=1 Tax=Actinomadura craniellae TaxID=2231787 RepID=A0A365H9Y7_9ACTN|nr:lytic transglycosylase domain-containing protein [Actinomadura craniellae]